MHCNAIALAHIERCVCGGPMGPAATPPEAPAEPLRRADPPRLLYDSKEVHVYVDASFRMGEAGLAVTGALGEHTRRVKCTTSHKAEIRALELAMDIARKQSADNIVFFTDCLPLLNGYRGAGNPERGWTVRYIPRSQNKRADLLARRARTTRPPCDTRPATPSPPRRTL